ncbi:hypothetical protein SAMN05216436_11974 [bacterium A37T11]|nr:hypothetical protein SAMN05216436_11974 [bacterium A37T11]
MRTSLNELHMAEAYLFDKAFAGDYLLFEARLLIEPGLREETQWQQKTYELVREYGRRQLRKEICMVEKQLFSEPEHRSFRQRIAGFFRKK